MLGARAWVLPLRFSGSSWVPAFAILVLLAGLLLTYSRLIFEGLVLSGYDTQTYFYPYWKYAFDALRVGRIPLWNPTLFMGAPFLANPQAAVFYPLNWLLLGLSAERAISIAIVIHVGLAALGTLCLGRYVMRLDWPAATVGASIFSFGGYFLGQAGHVNQVSATAWIPWLLLALDRSIAGDRRALAIAPIITALMVLAGHPQVVYMSLVFGLAYVLVVGIAGRQGSRWCGYVVGAAQGVGVWVIAGSGGALLAAAQLLPTLELSHYGIRSAGLTVAESASFSLSGKEFVSALLPTFWELPSSTEFVAHVGTAGLILAVFGIVAPVPRAYKALLIATVVAALLLAVGPATPAFSLAHRILPGFDLFRVPSRWLLLGTLATSLLAAQGVQVLGCSTPSSTKIRRGLIAGLILAVFGLFLAIFTIRYPVHENSALWWTGVGIASLVTVVSAYAARWAWVRWLVALFVVGELVFAAGPGLAREPVPVEAYGHGTVAHALLSSNGLEGRVLSTADPSFEMSDLIRARLADEWLDRLGERSWREFLVTLKNEEIMNPNLPMAWGLSVADGYDGGVLPLRAYADFRDILIPGTGENPDVLTQHVLSGMPSDRVLDGLGVTSVIRNHEATLKLDTAILDLGSSRRVHTTETWDGLNVMNVVGVAIVIDAPQGEPPGNVGAVELHFLDGESVVLPLWRSSERPERIALGPGHVVSEREGLDRPSFYSEVGLLSRHDVATVMVSAESGSFDLRALALIHPDGRTTSLQLRQGVDAVSWAVGEVLLTRRVSGASRAWLTTDVSLAANHDEARAFVRRESFDPLKSTVLTIAPETVHGAASLFDAARALGVIGPTEKDGRVGPDEAVEIRGLFQSSRTRVTDGDSVELVHEEPERLVFRVRTAGARMLVIPDTPYPGWNARVNGVDRSVWHVNVGHRGLLIPDAGDYKVEFVYRSVPFEVGRKISIGALVLLGLLVGGALSRRVRWG